MAEYKIQTGIRFDEIMLGKMKFIAKKNHRSLNAQMEFLAQECIKAYEKANGEILMSEEEKYLR